jgi:hypothetical protein
VLAPASTFLRHASSDELPGVSSYCWMAGAAGADSIQFSGMSRSDALNW